MLAGAETAAGAARRDLVRLQVNLGTESIPPRPSTAGCEKPTLAFPAAPARPSQHIRATTDTATLPLTDARIRLARTGADFRFVPVRAMADDLLYAAASPEECVELLHAGLLPFADLGELLDLASS